MDPFATLRTACRAISGKGPAYADLLTANDEAAMEAPFLNGDHYITYIGVKGSIVDSRRVACPGHGELEAQATPPIELRVKCPPRPPPQAMQPAAEQVAEQAKEPEPPKAIVEVDLLGDDAPPEAASQEQSEEPETTKADLGEEQAAPVKEEKPVQPQEQKPKRMVQLIKVQGPHGPVEVPVPEGATPGAELLFRLTPPPEYRMEVPPYGRGGSKVRFRREDGVEAVFIVPPGLGPGDTFEVTPPVHMVRVPVGAAPGTPVVFPVTRLPVNPMQPPEWCRSVVPQGMRPGQYFAARLPPPRQPQVTRGPAGFAAE